jgi:hypothetical protein
MGDTKFYNGTEHIFFSDNGTKTHISSGSGQELNITCSNLKADNLSNDKLTYSATNPLNSDHQRDIRSSLLFNAGSTNQGHRIAVSDSPNYNILVTLAAGTGIDQVPLLATVRNSTTSPLFTTYPNLIEGSIPLTGLFLTNSVDISEVGNRIVWANGHESGSTIYVHNRVSSTWVQSTTTLNGLYAKITGEAGAGRIIVSDRDESVKIYFQNVDENNFTLEQTLKAAESVTDANILVDIDGTTCVYHYDEYLIIFTRSGTTWTFIDEVYVGPVINSLCLKNGVISCSTTEDLYIFTVDNGVITNSFTSEIDNIIDTCTNGTFVFCLTNEGIITFYNLASPVRSPYETKITDANSICCSNTYVIVGRRTSFFNVGSQNSYNILPFTGDVEYNSIILNETDMKIKSNYGSIILDNVTFNGSINESAMRLNIYKSIGGSGGQSYAVSENTRVHMTTNVMQEIPNLVISYVDPGSRFTNNNNYSLKLLICYSVRCKDMTPDTNFVAWIKQSNKNENQAQSSSMAPASGIVGLSGSCIIVLEAYTFFEFFVFGGSTGNISSNDTVHATMLNIYSLI